MKTYIFVNGILNNPGAADGWTDQAVTWIHTNTINRAEKFEYCCGAITRRLGQRKRADNLAALLSRYSDSTVILVAHSNGCDLVARALRVCGTKVERVHLFSGACEADFFKNGFNSLLGNNRVGSFSCYRATADRAMRFARLTSYFLRWFGLGYGTLGLTGPLRVADVVAQRVKAIDGEGFGHSEWFEPEHFDETMLKITRI